MARVLCIQPTCRPWVVHSALQDPAPVTGIHDPRTPVQRRAEEIPVTLFYLAGVHTRPRRSSETAPEPTTRATRSSSVDASPPSHPRRIGVDRSRCCEIDNNEWTFRDGSRTASTGLQQQAGCSRPCSRGERCLARRRRQDNLNIAFTATRSSVWSNGAEAGSRSTRSPTRSESTARRSCPSFAAPADRTDHRDEVTGHVAWDLPAPPAESPPRCRFGGDGRNDRKNDECASDVGTLPRAL